MVVQPTGLSIPGVWNFIFVQDCGFLSTDLSNEVFYFVNATKGVERIVCPIIHSSKSHFVQAICVCPRLALPIFRSPGHSQLLLCLVEVILQHIAQDIKFSLHFSVSIHSFVIHPDI